LAQASPAEPLSRRCAPERKNEKEVTVADGEPALARTSTRTFHATLAEDSPTTLKNPTTTPYHRSFFFLAVRLLEGGQVKPAAAAPFLGSGQA